MAAMLFAVSVLAVKLLGHAIPVLEITLVRSGLSFALTMAIARARGVAPVMGRPASRWKLVGRGVTGSLAMASYYVSVMLLPLADAASLFFLNPAITAVLARLLLGEHFGPRGAAGSALCLAGLVALVQPPFLAGGHSDWGPRRLLGAAAGLASAFLSSGAFIFIRVVGKAEPALVVALYFHTATLALSSLPLALAWPQRAVLPTPREAGLLVAVAATSFAGQLLLTRGFQMLEASQAACINFTQVVYSYMFGIFLFGDHLSLAGVGGSVAIAAGIWLVNSRSKAAASGAAKGGGQSGKQPGGQSGSHAYARAGSSWGDDEGGGGLAAVDLSRSTMPEKAPPAARDAAGYGAGSFTALRALLLGIGRQGAGSGSGHSGRGGGGRSGSGGGSGGEGWRVPTAGGRGGWEAAEGEDRRGEELRPLVRLSGGGGGEGLQAPPPLALLPRMGPV